MYEFRFLIAGSLGLGLFPQSFPFRLHFAMFLPALLGHCSEEQKQQWLEKAWRMDGIVGTYAQTEMGHGTYLRGLECRADYDIAAKEFVLNTPTQSAYKWWPGGLGKTANMVVLMAQLYIEGKPKGLQPFLVRIRSEETHQPLPGVDVGEVGPRIGLNGVDNGFLGLKNVRIPLNQMLAKHNQVLPDGQFIKGPEPLLLYGTMVFVRVMIVRDVCLNLLSAATIATRYSAVRRQGLAPGQTKELKIMDFVTQQHKLFPQIAKGIFFRLAADHIWERYRLVQSELNAGHKHNLPDLHALSCCLKAVCSHSAAQGIEVLRQACGGHGFMASANFGNIYAAATAACTYEGENTVLLLQTARFLVKSYEAGLKRKVLPQSVAYLRTAGPVKWACNMQNLVGILEFSAMEAVKQAFLQRRKPEQQHGDGDNRAGLLLLKAANMHGRAFLARVALEHLKSLKQSKLLSEALYTVLQQLQDIFIMDLFQSSLADILSFNAGIKAVQLQQLERLYESTLLEFRRNAVAIVDGFDFHDRVLGSTLGCYDGQVYKRLMETARQTPLNQETVNATFEGHLKKLMIAKL